MKQTKLSKAVSVLNRMHDYFVKAFEDQRGEWLELTRRLHKLEALHGVEWKPDGRYDGDYVPRVERSAGDVTGVVRVVKLKDLGKLSA